MTAPEFSRVERLDTLGPSDRAVAITATEAERTALAQRFGLVSIESLEAAFEVRAEPAGVIAHGTVSASVVQACSVTGESLPVSVREEIAVRFVEEAAVDVEEIELAEDALDTMFFTGGGVDLGEAAAETVALALDPFPRGPNAARALKAAGVIAEDEVAQATPASALAGLRDLLDRK